MEPSPEQCFFSWSNSPPQCELIIALAMMTASSSFTTSATTAAVADPVKSEVPAPTAELAQLLLVFFVSAQSPE